MLHLQHPILKDFSFRSCLTGGAIMAVAVALRAALDRVLPNTPPFITLYPAMALVGLVCGPVVGGLASLLGLAAAIYLWIPPRMSFGIATLSDSVAVGLFVVASSIVLFASATLRGRLAALGLAKDALDLGLAAGGIGTWEYNFRTGRISASKSARALHGLPETACRTTVEDWLRGVPADDLAVLRETLRAAVAGGTMASYTYRVFGAPDGPICIAARGRVVSSGRDRRLLCALVDITEQSRVQGELQRERERLRLALQAGALAVWDYDPATDTATIDSRYAVTLGAAADVATLTRSEIGERIHPEDRARVAAEHEAIIADGTDYTIEYRIVAASGEIRWVVSQGIPLGGDVPSGGGRIVGIIQDITDRRRREADLLALAATRELLVREADHRIKNSLQLVISLLSLQLRGVEDPAAAEALRGAITRVGAIAASHLALQGSEDFRLVDLAVTLKDLCAHFCQLHTSIDIVCRADGALMMEADRAISLALAVNEVLTNALRHAFTGRAGGVVSVDAWLEGSQLVVRVSDDGVGLPPASGAGGLGSRIIRSLATQISAAIDVETRPQAGTAVTLRLPLRADDPPSSLAQATAVQDEEAERHSSLPS